MKETGVESWLLALGWPSLDHCGHRGSEPVYTAFLFNQSINLKGYSEHNLNTGFNTNMNAVDAGYFL